jgi:glucose-1-phosphate thymidylyltransferase
VTTSASKGHKHREVIGLLPAGGQAERLGPLPCSKEIYPVGFQYDNKGRIRHPKVASHYLLERMKRAGIRKAFIVLRDGKWDIPAYLGDGEMVGIQLAYLIMGRPFGAPYTLDQAYPFVQDAVVALGFPDIIFEPEDAFVQVLNKQAETQADVVLGIFPTDEPGKWDMIDLDEHGQIRKIVIKPPRSNLTCTWALAVWSPSFSEFMHQYLAQSSHAADRTELHVGNVIQAAISVPVPRR